MMFSKSYLKQPATQRDSERLRNRLGVMAGEAADAAYQACVRLIRVETGADMPHGIGGYDLTRFFGETEEFRDVLDAVTCMVRAIRETRGDPARWIAFCKRVFDEEGMAYSVDDKGEVHYRVDVAFHETAEGVIAALAGGRYAAASACANKAVEQMTKAHPDGKHAIRDIFEGVETVFKVTAGTNKLLAQANIAAELTPIVNNRFPDADPIARGAAMQTLESLKDWTNACHKYRHGHDAAEPVEPPLELSVILVGNGLNFARWIAALAG